MHALIKGAAVFLNGAFVHTDICLRDGVVTDIAPDLPIKTGGSVFFLDGCHLLPGLTDIHVHLRVPGFAYKETIETGTRAAARGGFTLVCAMPNVNPAPDSMQNLACQLEIIKREAVVPVLPYACITVGRQGAAVVDMAALRPLVAGFSDDGGGVQADEMMLAAMRAARKAGALIAAHCEDTRLVPPGGCAHNGAFARARGLAGMPAESEWRQLERDLRLVAQTGARYHACHLSCKESVRLMRRAKARGLPVSCETAPHYLALCDDDLQDDGRFKMNPPIRTAEDRKALIDGLLDGTVDVVATDHAPHAREEKNKGFAGSLLGVVGLETAFAVAYTSLVAGGCMHLEALVRAMSEKPRRVLGLPENTIKTGCPLDAVAVDLRAAHTVDPAGFASLGKSTPFEGMRAYGQPVATWAGGRLVHGMEKENRV